MILVDSLMLSGLRWLLHTIEQAARAELEDDTPLREALVEASLRFEAGELSREEFVQVEEQILLRLNEVRSLRAPAAGTIVLEARASGGGLAVQASVAGDFHQPPPPARARTRAAAARPRPRPRRKACP